MPEKYVILSADSWKIFPTRDRVKRYNGAATPVVTPWVFLLFYFIIFILS
jgi:hypothetical protein